MSVLKVIATVLSLIICQLSFAKTAPFGIQQLELSFAVSQSVAAGNILGNSNAELIVVGQKLDKRMMAILVLDEKGQYGIAHVIEIPNKYFAFDLGVVQKNGLQQLYFLAKNTIDVLALATPDNKTQFVQVEQVSSMMLANVAPFLSRRNFAGDLNDDKQDDFILSQFETVNLWLSQCCGTRHQQALDINAIINIGGDMVSFRDIRLHFVDVNNDSKTDIVRAQQGELVVYQQTADGLFNLNPYITKIPNNIYGLNWWDIRESDGENLDQSNLSHKVVEDLNDINGDGITDLIVRFTKSSGVLDRVNDYEFYLGNLDANNQWLLPTKPNSTISAEETLSDLVLIDINNDKKFEVMVSSFELGLSQIIGALLSSSIDQEQLIYAMDENKKFAAKPIVNHEVELNFSLSKGKSGEPLVKVIDIDGDKLKDLVFSDGDSSLKIYYATADSKKPFNSRSTKFSVNLPKNASSVLDHDVNNDGKQDLIFHFGRLDADNLANKINILLAN